MVHVRKSLPVKSDLPQSAASMIMINVGAGLDIPTGSFLPGKYGEHMLNGGLGIVTGMTGKGNNFKTTTMEWMMGRAAARSSFDMDTDITVLDTESNKDHNRINRLLQANNLEFRDIDLFAEGRYTITDKADMYGEKWFSGLKKFLEEKEKNRKELLQETPFMSADKVNLVKIMQPTFSLIDSFSEFETSNTGDMMEKNEIGDSGANTLYMRQGLDKTRLLMEYPKLGIGNQHYLLTTTHFGKEGPQMGAGPYAPPPEKKMNSMRQGDAIKGAPPKYFFLVHWLGHASGSTVLKTKDGIVDYPVSVDDKRVGDTDLWEVPINTLRSKTGPSSWSTSLVVSQTHGVLPSLTEFHMLRKSRWGLVGNDQNYVNALLPEEKLSRTVIRRKLDTNAALRRATNIASELYQMSLYHRHSRDIIMEPEELYAKIKEQGYNWDMILTKTRGWWKTNNSVHPLLPLSTMDLLNMATGRYTPYWLESDKNVIKKEYILDMPYEFH